MNVDLGQTFTLTFPITLGTGYGYTILSTPNIALLTPQGTVTKSSDLSGRVGASTTIQYTFRAIASGHGAVYVQYGRAWDSSTWTFTTYDINVA